MKDHTRGGLSGLIFRLTVLAFALAGVFHFFTFVLFRTPSDPLPKKQQVKYSTDASDAEEPKDIKEKLLRPSVPLKAYKPAFQPKPLINVEENTTGVEHN